MTRTTFTLENVFMTWLKERKRPYEIYYDGRTVYAIPLVSTRPVVYGVLRTETEDVHRSVVEKIREETDIENLYPIDGLQFDETRSDSDDE